MSSNATKKNALQAQVANAQAIRKVRHAALVAARKAEREGTREKEAIQQITKAIDAVLNAHEKKKTQKGGRASRKNMTRMALRVPQTAVNTALGIVKTTRKGTVRIVKRAGKGAVGITGTALGATRNIGKTAVGTAGNVGVKATKGLTKMVKNSLNLASNATKGLLKGLTRVVNTRKTTRRRRR